MRVLLVNALRTRGGEERVVLDLIQGLIAAGEDVTVACDREAVLADAAEAFGASVLKLRLKSKHSVTAAWELRRHIKERGFDILHVHGSYSSLHARLAAQGFDVAVVWTVQLHPAWGRPDGRLPGIYRFAYAGALRWLDGITRHTVFVSQGLADETIRFMGRAPHAWSVIPNGVDVDRYRPDRGRRERFRRSLGIQLRRPVVGITARLTPRKGIDTFIRAISILRRDDVLALVVGSGEQLEPLQRLSADQGVVERVRFLGDLPSTEDFVASIDIGALPSHGEGFPLSVMEMLAAGVPCVVSDITMHRRFDVVGEAVRFAPVGDFQAFARAIDSYLAWGECDERRAMARESAITHFSTGTMVEAYRDLYRLVVQQAPEAQGGRRTRHAECRER